MLQHSLIMDFENIRIKFHIFYYFTTLLCFLFLFYSISSPLYIQFCSAALLLFFLLKKYLSTLFLVVRVYSVFLWIYCRWDLVVSSPVLFYKSFVLMRVTRGLSSGLQSSYVIGVASYIAGLDFLPNLTTKHIQLVLVSGTQRAAFYPTTFTLNFLDDGA